MGVLQDDGSSTGDRVAVYGYGKLHSRRSRRGLDGPDVRDGKIVRTEDRHGQICVEALAEEQDGALRSALDDSASIRRASATTVEGGDSEHFGIQGRRAGGNRDADSGGGRASRNAYRYRRGKSCAAASRPSGGGWRNGPARVAAGLAATATAASQSGKGRDDEESDSPMKLHEFTV